MAVQPPAEPLLDVATRVLLQDPAASLAQVAAAAGMSRTSLHTRYPTRLALLVALAHGAMDHVEAAYREARLDADEPGEQVMGRLVELLLPLGPRVEFLLRERSLDDLPDVVARYERLDDPLSSFVERAQRRGELAADVPPWWVTSSLIGGVYTAWEVVASGRLAPRDAPALVLRTLLSGVGPR